MEHTIVDTPTALASALARIDEPVVGVDVERADAPRYFRRAALIQVGTATDVVLVDPLALDPVPLLGDFLAERVSVLHAIENDVEPLRAAGVELGPHADTAVAAALLGMPTGLDPLLQEVLDVALSPDKDRYQRADWEQRPLPEGMCDYAAGDVVHLPELWRHMAGRLDDAGRRGWYDEELAAVVTGAFEDTRDWTRTKGAGRLSARQRAVLRHLWQSREEIARTHDLAPNRVLREQVLVDLATKPPADVRDLIRRNQRRGRPARAHAELLWAALQAGLVAPEEPRQGNGRWDETDRAAFDAMRTRRAEVADRLGLDSGVLCPSRALWGPVRGNPTSPAQLCELAGLRRWQAEVLADELWDAYVTARAGTADEEASVGGADVTDGA